MATLLPKDMQLTHGILAVEQAADTAALITALLIYLYHQPCINTSLSDCISTVIPTYLL